MVTTAVDSGPNNLDTSDTNGVFYTNNTYATDDAGDFALDASGDFNFIDSIDDPVMHIIGDLTLEVYAFPNDPYGGDPRRGHTIVTKKSAEVGVGISSYAIGYDQVERRFSGSIDVSADTSTPSVSVRSAPGILQGQWYHLALVFEKDFDGPRDRLALYVNHRLVDENTGSDLGEIHYSSNDLVIGASNFNTSTGTGAFRRNLDGLIDEVRLSDEALSPSQMLMTDEIFTDGFEATALELKD